MMISDVMSRPVVTVHRADSLATAAAKLWQADCGALAVVDDDSVLCGMITDRDICMSAWLHGAALSTIRVAEAMAKHVFSLYADQDICYAIAMMSAHQVRRIPVIDDDRRPLGIITINDLARITTAVGSPVAGLVDEISRTYAKICSHGKRAAA